MRPSGRSRPGPLRAGLCLFTVLFVLAMTVGGWALPAAAQTNSTSIYTTPDLSPNCPEAGNYDPMNPFNPEPLCQEPSLWARVLAGGLNWIYQALALLVGGVDTHDTVFGCQNPKGGCVAASTGRWEVFGVADQATYDGVIRSWQWASWTLGTVLFLLAVVWTAYEYMFSAFNPESRVSLNERIQWMLFAVAMMALAPTLVGIALKLNLSLVREFAQMAGVFSLQTAVSEALSRGNLQVGFGIPLALLATIWIRLVLYLSYLTRSWVVSILWGLAPFLGGALLLFPKLRGVVGQYWRLVLGEIFMQAIHAVLLSFLFTWLGRVPQVDPMLVFSLAIGFWAFSGAIRGILFGPGSGIAQGVGLGSAAAAAVFTTMAMRNVSDTIRGLAGVGGSLIAGKGGGPAGVGGVVATPIEHEPAGAPSGSSASQASGDVLRSPVTAANIARWREAGSRAGRLLFGTTAGILGAAAGAVIGDHRIGEAISRMGADLGERAGHVAGGLLAGGVPGAVATARAYRQAAKGFAEALPDAPAADRKQMAIAAVGGTPAAFAQTREGVDLGAAQIGAAVGYGFGGRVGAWIGAHVGRTLTRLHYANRPNSVIQSAKAQSLAQVLSEAKPGSEIFVQSTRHGAFAEIRTGDGNVTPVLLKGGDRGLPAHLGTQLVRYQVTELMPGRYVPVERGRHGYAPQTVSRAPTEMRPGLDSFYDEP